ncbi:MAG TPA: DapH/DapD/GlmU-related protein, partial [Marmoricola sp.]|nr:2,3,4,5-tetrahydropyridine-2,6-dicarboxylate N-succinyltransferase [Nocardioidaceae bacterium]HRV68962.1 DapH/DapD/GlmU-related protein [Marmoricola sp.]
VGANAGVGISLGNDCVVEAGLYVTAGTKVALVGQDQTVKAAQLSGVDNLLFRRNSQTGSVEAVATAKQGIELNAALHAN